MANFLIKVTNYEYGQREKEYRMEAGNAGTAAARAFRQAKKDKVFGKHRFTEYTIKIKKI